MPRTNWNTVWNTVAAKRVRDVAKLDDIDQAIEKIVGELIGGLTCPPTDLEALALKMGVTDICSDDTMLVPGELRKLRNELVVFLFPGLAKTRRRFTLAHELGHVFFENAERRPHPSQELERLCDKFAAEFLMPRRVFVSYAGRHPNLRRVYDLHRIFETGLSATLNRVSDIYKYRAVELQGDRAVWRRRMSIPILKQVSSRLQELSDKTGTETITLDEKRGQYRVWKLEWMVLGQDHRIGLLYPA